MPSMLDAILGHPITQAALSGLQYGGNLLDTYSGASSVRDLVAGEDPLDQWFDPQNEEKRLSGRQMLEKRGWSGENTDQGWMPDLGDLGGFAAEMVLDPTNLLGGLGLAKKLMGISKAKAANRGIEAANALSKEQRAMGFMPEEVAKLTKIVDETGAPKKMYHGTPYVFDKFDEDKLDPSALFGKGIYTSDSTHVTGGPKGYWRKGAERELALIDSARRGVDKLPSPRGIGLSSTHVTPEDVDNIIAYHTSNPTPHGEKTIAALQPLKSQFLESRSSGLDQEILRGLLNDRNMAPNVRQHFIDARNPLEIEAMKLEPPEALRGELIAENRAIVRDGLDKVREYRAANNEQPFLTNNVMTYFKNRHKLEPLSGDEIYTRLGPGRIKEAGYDAIHHVGGGNTGGAPHNVVIALDPSQVYLPYIAKELQDLQSVASPNSLLMALAGKNALQRHREVQ